MDEAQIVNTLKQNLPQPSEPTTAPPVVGDPTEAPINIELDEVSLYKLHQHFAEDYRPGDQDSNQQISYIYNAIAQQLGTSDYPFVVAKINELQRMLGFRNTENARFKLYQWLKLDQKRSRIELEQGALYG